MAIMVKMDNGRVLYAFRQSPKIFADEIDHWFNKERLSFLGAMRNAQSGIRGKLLDKERWGRGGKWSPQVVGQFKSVKNHPGQLDENMSMGFAPNSPLEKAMELLEKGGNDQSDKFMPIPVWENLSKVGINKGSYQAFKDMSETGSLFSIPGKNGRILWLSKVFGNMGKPLLLFVGAKSIKVKKQFDFHKTWARRYPKIMKRGEQAIFRATRKVESMIKQGDLSGI